MKIIGVIPARYQSSRFPGKPLADICGKPMIWWVYQQCKKVTEFSEIIVATDDERIMSACVDYGMRVILTSPDHKTGTDRLGEVADKIDADFYVNIQGDEPLIEPAVIQSVIRYKEEHPNAEIINTMTGLRDDDDVKSNTIVKVVASDDLLIYLSRASVPFSKEGKDVYYKKHLGLYGLSKSALQYFSNRERGIVEKIEDIEMLRFLEGDRQVRIIEVTSSTIGVDTPEDIKKVEREIQKRCIDVNLLERGNGNA